LRRWETRPAPITARDIRTACRRSTIIAQRGWADCHIALPIDGRDALNQGGFPHVRMIDARAETRPYNG
jgi:hypothetical protein